MCSCYPYESTRTNSFQNQQTLSLKNVSVIPQKWSQFLQYFATKSAVLSAKGGSRSDTVGFSSITADFKVEKAETPVGRLIKPSKWKTMSSIAKSHRLVNLCLSVFDRLSGYAVSANCCKVSVKTTECLIFTGFCVSELFLFKGYMGQLLRKTRLNHTFLMIRTSLAREKMMNNHCIDF